MKKFIDFIGIVTALMMFSCVGFFFLPYVEYNGVSQSGWDLINLIMSISKDMRLLLIWILILGGPSILCFLAGFFFLQPSIGKQIFTTILCGIAAWFKTVGYQGTIDIAVKNGIGIGWKLNAIFSLVGLGSSILLIILVAMSKSGNKKKIENENL